MAIIQISKIQMRRGYEIDIPGKPLTTSPLTFEPGLDEGEFGFSIDTGRLFIGQSPMQGQPNYRRIDFPYQNIEILTENSTLVMRKFWDASHRTIGTNAFYTGLLVPTDIFTDVSAITSTGTKTFRMEGETLLATINYYIYTAVDTFPVKNGTLRIMSLEGLSDADIRDDSISDHRLNLTGTDAITSEIVHDLVEFRVVRAGTASDPHFRLQYRNMMAENLRIYFQLVRPNPVALNGNGEDIFAPPTNGGLGGSGGAPAEAQYLTLANDPMLPNERRLVLSDGLIAVDGGAGNLYTVKVAFGASTPSELGLAGSAGSSSLVARADHVHPAPIVSTGFGIQGGGTLDQQRHLEIVREDIHELVRDMFNKVHQGITVNYDAADGQFFLAVSNDPNDPNGISATRLVTPRKIELIGSVFGEEYFDGTTDIQINARLQKTGVVAGTYNTVTVNDEGRVVSASNIDLSGTPIPISLVATGDVGGSTSTGTITLTLSQTGVVAGTYNTVTVDAKGRVIAASNTPYLTTSSFNPANYVTTASGVTGVRRTNAGLVQPNGVFGWFYAPPGAFFSGFYAATYPIYCSFNCEYIQYRVNGVWYTVA